MKLVMVLFALIFVSQAQAESVVCQGIGRFSEIPKTFFSLESTSNYASKDILMLPTGRVSLLLEKQSSDGSYYLNIEVKEQDKLTEEYSAKGAKGLASGLVVYTENVRSFIACRLIK